MPIVDMERLKRSGQRFANGFSPGQKVISVLAIAGLGFALFTFTKWAATTDYAPLYSNLDSSDASDITAELDARGVSYELSNGGATILVPRADVYQTRIDLSAKGMPNGGDGYALLDDKSGSITQSEFSQRVDYQRAVQTELANTIMAMDGVRAATVNLTLPSDDPFVGADQEQAKAAVLLDLGSAGMDAEQTQAVVHLVSSSVADLTPDSVTVTDTQGNVLAAPGGDDSLQSSQNLAKTAAYETALAGKIEAMLAKSLGPGHATVAVTAEMNFDQSIEERTTSTPNVDATGAPIPESASEKETQYVGPGNNTTGVLGPDGTPTGGATTDVSFLETDRQVNNAFNTTIQTIENAGGDLERLNVAVMVDRDKVPGGVAALTELISTAAGIDTARGDTLAVQPAVFDEKVQAAVEQQITAAETGSSATDMLGIARYLLTLLIVGLVLFFAWRAVKRAQLAMGPTRVPLDLAALEAAGYSVPALAELGSIHEAMNALPERPTPLEPQRSSVEHEVTDLIDRQPEEVAQTLRSWLADRRA